MTSYKIDQGMTGQDYEVTARAIEILKDAGWDVEFSDGVFGQDDHAYAGLPMFDTAFWNAVEEAAAEAQDDDPDRELNAVMTVAEAAAEFGLNVSGIRATIERGSIPARQSGSTWLIRRADAEARWGLGRVAEFAAAMPDDAPGADLLREAIQGVKSFDELPRRKIDLQGEESELTDWNRAAEHYNLYAGTLNLLLRVARRLPYSSHLDQEEIIRDLLKYGFNAGIWINYSVDPLTITP